jgi:hypothetical protein
MIGKFIPAFLYLLGPVGILHAAQTDTNHVHPLLNCLDRWEIPDFDSKLYQAALFDGPCFSEMKVTMSLDNPALHGWVRRLDKDRFNVLLFGCLEVNVSQSGVERGSINWGVMPIVDPDQKHWLEAPVLRGSSNAAYAADLVIIARGYEAGGQRDMARWLVDQVLAKFGSEEHLARLAEHRFADWHYQAAMDRWLVHADWKRLAGDLEELAAKAPQDWPYLPAIQDLRLRITKVPQEHTDANPVRQIMQRSLYGPGRVSGWFQIGNWVLFPLSERRLNEHKGRFDDLMSLDASALPIWAELMEDNTPCAALYSTKGLGRQPEAGELPRRPSWTSAMARGFIQGATLWRIDQNESTASIRDKCMRTSKLLSGKNSQEKFLVAAEQGDKYKRDAAIYGLYDVGFEGPWSGVESQILNDCRSARAFTSSPELFVNLRKSKASALVQQIEQAGASTWTLGPNIMKGLKDGLAFDSFEEVLKKWPEHRGKQFIGASRDWRPIYTTSPTRLLRACLNEATQTPAFFCDFIELAMWHRETPNNPIQLSWPGAQTSLAFCHEPIKELLHDQSAFPLASRARGQGQLAENRAHMIAWMMLDSTVEYRKALSFDGYAVLGVEWLDELVAECRKTMEDGSLPDLGGVKRFADSLRFVPPEQDTIVQALQWDAAHFREKWRSLPLSQRIALAGRPIIPVEGDLKKLRSVVRNVRGQDFVKPGDQLTDDVFGKMIKWAGDELPKSQGVCGMVRWRSGLAGVDVETDSFADSSALAQSVIDGFKQAYNSKPDAGHLILVSVRCGSSIHGWMVEAGSHEQASIHFELTQWLENLPESKLAQISFWLVGIAKDVLN